MHLFFNVKSIFKLALNIILIFATINSKTNFEFLCTIIIFEWNS
jgi:hypothetical protein